MQDLREVQMKGDEVHMCDSPYNFHLFLILLFSRKASSRRLSFPVPLNYKNYFLSNLPDIFFQIMSNNNRSALIIPKTPYDGQKNMYIFFQIMSNHNRSALIIPTTPYNGQKPGTRGLRKAVKDLPDLMSSSLKLQKLLI